MAGLLVKDLSRALREIKLTAINTEDVAERLLARPELLIVHLRNARTGWVSKRRWGSDGTDGVGHGFFISLEPLSRLNCLPVVVVPLVDEEREA
jgi:hypothetical protein